MVDGFRGDNELPHNLNVLVVDDNRDAADSMAMLLDVWGFKHQVAYDGATALRVARDFRPECVILDISMPQMDGCTLARRLRNEQGLERTKLIALTAYSDEENTRRIKQAGFDYHFIKPAPPSDLERILNMLDEVIRLASKTEELVRQNVALAGQTQQILQGVKEEIKGVKNEVAVAGETRELLREVKQDLREVKEEVKELKVELREVKDALSEEA